MPLTRRQAGVLLHPTSLPGPYGMGDIGPSSVRFLDWMRDAGLALWQVLPLGPTGFGDSPYQCFSAFAGNPYLVSPDLLVQSGLAEASDLKSAPRGEGPIDYGRAIEWKVGLLRRAFEKFTSRRDRRAAARLEAFRADPAVREWLEGYCLFAALKSAHNGATWNTWSPELRSREKAALASARVRLAGEIAFHEFAQFLFAEQWSGLRAAARERGISIVGDAPIYVAYDSADTWAHQDLFQLTPDGTPTHVAGVPPDYFSKTGQLWGNPLYRWEKLQSTKFAWWVARLRAVLAQVDIVRLDHFRGFAGYWSVPFGESTAINGKWEPGPGAALFAALKKALGDLPIIAEDLGVITPDVVELRTGFGLPGMKILQFAWGTSSVRPLVPDADNDHAYHKIERTSVVYTGTHDNPPTRGWWDEFASPGEKALLAAWLGREVGAPHDELIRAGFESCADTVLVPMQDFLGLGNEARMNFPGRAEGNWCWRMKPHAPSRRLARQVRQWLTISQRL